MSDHVHMLLSVPPRYSIAMIIGYLKGKSAIRIHRDYGRIRGSLFGHSFWSRGYCVSTIGLDEESIRRYIEDGVPPGDFLSAFLSNNLKESFARADYSTMDFMA